MQAVYIDVLIAENFVMDYFILYMTSKILYHKKAVRPRRMLLRLAFSSGLGVIYTVTSVLLIHSALSLFIFKVILSLGMVWVAFYPKNVHQILKSVGCFYGVTLLAGGAATVVVSETGTEQYLFIVFAVVAVVGDVILKSIRQHRAVEKYSVDLYVQFEEAGVWLPALVDSGNELKDPCSGQPVIVVELDAVRTILPPEIVTLLKTTEGDAFFSREVLERLDTWATKLRLVPFASLGCKSGLLVGFRAETVRIGNGTVKGEELHNLTVCICAQTLSADGLYKGLLGQELLSSRGNQENCQAIPA